MTSEISSYPCPLHPPRDISPPPTGHLPSPTPFCRIMTTKYSTNMLKLPHTLGVFTLLTSRFLKSRHFDPTIYTCAKTSRSFSFTKLRDFLVGSAHVRSQATVHAFMHAAHAVCMRAADVSKSALASSPEVPKVTWWKIATFLGYHLHWLTSLETSRHFRKIALRLAIFLAMFFECLCVVARQLAPKCRDFSNVAKLASRCKWPYCF